MSADPVREASVRTLLVGDIDADEPLAVALELAAALRARVHAVHVLNHTDAPIDPDLPQREQQTDRGAVERRTEVINTAGEAGVSCTYERRRGNPATELITAADEQDATLIVIGTRGDGVAPALSRLFAPSVSLGVIRHQHRPVLVVPTNQAPPDATAQPTVPGGQ